MNQKAILFDLDGTLANSARDLKMPSMLSWLNKACGESTGQK